MMRTGAALRAIYDTLWEAYGPQGWWPGDSPTEIVIGAILTQNTAWSNVEKAIAKLRDSNAVSWTALRDMSPEALALLIQPAGTYRVKARRLKAFVDQLWGSFDGSLDRMLAGDMPAVRERLLSIHGIGPETADAIMLYAGSIPTFVVDAYTNRILRRHLLLAEGETYDTVRAMFHRAMTSDTAVYNEYHALLVAVGKQHCRTRACCDGCPLAAMPHNGSL